VVASDKTPEKKIIPSGLFISKDIEVNCHWVLNQREIGHTCEHLFTGAGC